MKEKLLAYFLCLECRGSDWDLEREEMKGEEVRTGAILCRHCQRRYLIREGMVQALPEELPEEVHHEKEHAESLGYLVASNGEKHFINRQTLHRFREVFLSLPHGDGSHFFQPGGSFDNQAGNAERFFKALDFLKLKGGERVLEVGASFGWGSWRMAQRGCEAVALDVTDYLMASDLYMEKDGTYFERVMADMGHLPFSDETFDIVFSHSVIHHCKDLGRLFREFGRVLKPEGRVAALHECAFGLLEDKSGKALQDAIHEGFNENAYTIPEWQEGARKGGFKKVRLHFFSFIDDYVYRKQARKASETWKLRAAQWLQAHPGISQTLNALSVGPRILLRPKAWMMVATKS